MLEAIASGAFPVVTDIPANREWIVDGENGYIFTVDDEKTLARKILDAIHEKEMLASVRKSNQKIAEEKALWPICINRIKEIYEDLAKHRIVPACAGASAGRHRA